MEHIPTYDVDAVIKNIMQCVDRAFFQISLLPDHMGQLIGQHLHVSVFPYEWWASKFCDYEVIFSSHNTENAIFYVKKEK